MPGLFATSCTRYTLCCIAMGLLLAIGGCGQEQVEVSGGIQRGPTVAGAAFRVLVFGKTAGFRHSSIAAGYAAIVTTGTTYLYEADYTESSEVFKGSVLAGYASVVFLSPTGDVLNDAQQQAFEQYIASGGGFVGIHAAADCEYGWPWYGALLGRYFASHPAVQSATVLKTGSTHPITQNLPASISLTDEWYNFQSPLGPPVTVLLTVDEATYSGGTMGAEHPIAWCKASGSGRSFYTALGHTTEQFSNAYFLELLGEAIRWSAGY